MHPTYFVAILTIFELETNVTYGGVWGRKLK